MIKVFGNHKSFLVISAVCSLLILLSSASQVRANSTTIGLPAIVGNGNCIPFGCPSTFGTTTYQQDYTSAAFSAPFDVGAIDFFQTQILGGVPAGGTYAIEFSYTSNSVGALSLLSPTNNITSGNQQFFSGTLPGLVGGVMTITGTPFAYDPSLGNLLMTVKISSGTNSSPLFFLDQGQSQTQTSRAYFGTATGGNDGGELVSRFDTPSVSVTPEPSSLLLLGTGLLGLLSVLVKRKRMGQGHPQAT